MPTEDTLAAIANTIHDDCHGWFAPCYSVTRQDMRDTAKAAVQALHDAFADPVIKRALQSVLDEER